jgi:hypothetical protein
MNELNRRRDIEAVLKTGLAIEHQPAVTPSDGARTAQSILITVHPTL